MAYRKCLSFFVLCVLLLGGCGGGIEDKEGKAVKVGETYLMTKKGLELVPKFRDKGGNPLEPGKQYIMTAAGLELVPYLKVRTNDKLNQRLTSPAAYPDFFQKEEVEALLTNPAAYYIDPQKCQACGICARRCPVEAISGAKKQVHVIDQDQCIRCGTCYEACPSRFGAVQLIQGAPVPPPPEPGQAIVSPS